MYSIRTRLLLALLFFGVPFSTVHAQVTITVNTLDNEQEVDGDCSLREALWTAVINLPYDACVTGTTTGVDTVAFAVTGTIEVGFLPRIEDDTVINGPGADQLTLRAIGQDGGNRFFGVSAGATATIRGLTMTEGYAFSSGGGAILVFGGGSLHLYDSVLRNNRADFRGGAIYLENGGEALIENTIFDNNVSEGDFGGAINSLGTPIEIRRSVVMNNRAAQGGGGIATFNDGSALRAENTTFTGNTAEQSGGALYIGRGDANELAHVTITNNTSDNAGVDMGDGAGVLIGEGTVVRFRNTLIANNTDASPGGRIWPDVAVYGSMISEGNNLIGINEGSSFTNGTNNDLVGTPGQPLNPLLGALTNEASTFFFPPANGSPALSAGTCEGLGGSPLTVDQRGESRPQGSGCDIGAVETGDAGIGTNREAADIPVGHALSAVYPNPFNPEATFTLEMTQPQAVTVTVHDVLGRQVAVLHEGALGTGSHRYTLAASAWPSGLYLVRVEGEHFVATRRAVLLK